MAKRAKLDAALDFVREGDVLVVTKLDRLARSTQHLLKITEKLENKVVALRILNLGIDSHSATGKMMLTIIGSIAQFEREMMLERQKEGIKKAKAEGKYKGRKPTARAKRGEVMKLHGRGMCASDIAKNLSIGKASVYRLLKEVVPRSR